MPTFVIREARQDDLAELMRLERESFPLDAWSDATMRRTIASPHSRMLVIDTSEPGTEPALRGYASVLAAQGSGEADVETINIDPVVRRGGWATRLLAELSTWVAERGAKQLFLEVRANGDAAIRLYESLAFEEIGRRANYYRAEGQDAIVMRASIQDVIARAEQRLTARATEPEREAMEDMQS